MSSSQGWIKLHRSLLEWEWYKDLNTRSLFLHLLIRANHKDNRFQGNVVKRGQILTGINALSIETSLSVQQLRTSLKKLKSTNEITIESSSKNSVITVVNYDFYQTVDDDQQAEQQTNNKRSTSDQQTTNKRATTNKNEKNIKNEKKERREESIKFDSAENKFSSTPSNANLSLEDRKISFTEKLAAFTGVYSKDTLNEFYFYWTEKNENGKKMRFEMQKVFDIKRRLATWSKNEKQKFNGTSRNTSGGSRQQRIDEVANLRSLAKEIIRYGD
ncbi:hypothetical protein ACFSQ3_14640 [Sphingobacterium corticis]|uniref:Uncharacterized protein n=1 Tax=Sphingobacterium corticis TaxID=1812823 RepID=A0ABW5NNF6_9SPHI